MCTITLDKECYKNTHTIRLVASVPPIRNLMCPARICNNELAIENNKVLQNNEERKGSKIYNGFCKNNFGNLTNVRMRLAEYAAFYRIKHIFKRHEIYFIRYFKGFC